jgi:RNA polymerase sigma factor (sigma-70 family)
MQPTDDSALLRRYAENHSDEAFTALVTRHINLVYSVALRCVGGPHQAEEVAQAVFIILAKKAAQLRHDKALSSWLFQTTRLTASNFVRSESRRHRREQEAHMQSVLNEPGNDLWPKIAPMLDDAVADLNETDRQAIMLRFYEGRNLREVGAALGASEDAAEKRVNRAVEKLRTFFAKRGVTVGASGLAVVISYNAVQAAPVGLAVAISTALTGTTLAATTTATGAKAIAMTTLQKIIAVAAITVLVGAGIYKARQFLQSRGQVQAAQPQSSNITPRVAGQTSDRVQGWSSDIDFLLEAIKRKHYIYRAKPLPEATGKVADELKKAIGTMSDERVVAELLRLMATLGDGHCYVFPTDAFTARMPFRQLPLRLYHFADGLFVIDAEAGHERWIGRKITHLETVATEYALRRIAAYVPSDNRYTSRILGPILCGHRGILEMFGLNPQADEVSLRFVGPNGNPGEERIGFVPFRKLSQTERKLPPSRLAGTPPAPLYLRKTATNFWFEALPQGKAVYFQFNQVLDAPEESIETFSARLDTYLRQQRPGLLIVDVRNNNGGDASLLDPLVGALQDFERRDSTAKLVVITGPYTFSAAQIFIARVDHQTKAVFAGEPSASKPNFVGEDSPRELPWSRLAASISDRYHESIPGDTREWIEPEIKVELSSGDYFANRDPVLEAVLARYATAAKSGN